MVFDWEMKESWADEEKATLDNFERDRSFSFLFKLKSWHMLRLSSFWLLAKNLTDLLTLCFLRRAWGYMWVSSISSWSMNTIRSALLLQNACSLLSLSYSSLLLWDWSWRLSTNVQCSDYRRWLKKSHYSVKDLLQSRSPEDKRSRYG